VTGRGAGSAGPVRAAGGLVWRPGPGGRPLVCVVRRPRYRDWSLPKGKLLPGEHPLAGAVREVVEETGVRARPLSPLPRASYRVDGVSKVVDYWAMIAVQRAPFVPQSEVEDVAWLPVPDAAGRLSYPSDRDLLHHWAASPLVSAVVLLVRHAYAGERGSRPGPDDDRPLTASGQTDAVALCRLLELFRPRALVSAAPRRCVQTLASLAEATGLEIEVDAVFDERAAAPAAAAARLAAYAVTRESTVVCTQGAVIPAALRALGADGSPDAWAATAKGDGWLLPFAGEVPLSPSRLAVGSPEAHQRPDRG
jgi:8-oxo-(d)GTP phosphatase